MIDINALLRTDFRSFVIRAFRNLNDGQKLGRHPYLDYLCHELGGRRQDAEARDQLAATAPQDLSRRDLLFRLAARSEAVAQRILGARWYQSIFATRLAKGRSSVTDFGTKQGGSLVAVSADGSITGRGGDLIIYDDPLNIQDAQNLEQIDKINQRFDTIISSRLNNPKTGQLIIIAHRLNERDLSGHVLDQGGWRQVALPLIAIRDKVYELGYGKWKRKKGDLLRPDAFTKKDIERLRRNTMNPDFETFYQQSVARGARVCLKT